MADKKKVVKIVTPKFRAAFLNAFRPQEFEDGSEPKYGVIALFPKNVDISKIEKVATKAGIEKWGKEDFAKYKKSPKFWWPFRDGDDERSDYDGFADNIFINMTTKMKPGLIDSEKEPILDESEVYSGCYMRASIVAYAYDHKGNRGIGFSLQNLQKLADGEPFSGRSNAEDDFDEWDEDDDFGDDDDL